MAAAVSLGTDDIVCRARPPQVASVGLPFLFAELRDRAALERARIRMEGFEALEAACGVPHVHLYTRTGDEFDIRARMFAPFDGVPEDPATGSANCALAGLLSYYDPIASGSFQWRIGQGDEMGRPSALAVRANKEDGTVVGTWVGGTSVLVSDGFIQLD